MYVVPSGRSTSRKVRRIGSCQHTSGLVSSGCRPCCERQPVQRAAGAAGEVGAVVEDARLCRRPRRSGLAARRPRRSRSSPCGAPCPDGLSCQSSASSCSTNSATRFSSSLSAKCAPSVQQPVVGRRRRRCPWQPWPKMHVQRDVSQVRSQRNTWSASAGSPELDPGAGKDEVDFGHRGHPTAAPGEYRGPMRLGVLDIGSNTGHLLVVDAHGGAAPLPAYSYKEPLRLAEHLDDDGAVEPGAASTRSPRSSPRRSWSPRTRAARRCSASRPRRSATPVNSDEVLDARRATRPASTSRCCPARTRPG